VLICVAALIFDDQDRLFLVRRAPDRALFGGSWDVVGGHVEPGETPAEALRREVREETGWQVAGVVAELPPWTWQGDDGVTRNEYDHLVTVVGDLTAPVLDASEHTGYRWLAGSELDLLDDDPSQIRQLAGTAFAALHQGYAARLAPLLDQAFRSAMAAVAGGGGRELVQRFGGGVAGLLITFRFVLRWPGRTVTVPQADAVWRYQDRDESWTAVRASGEAGFLEVADGFRPGPKGAEFLTELYAVIDRVTTERWAGLDDTVARTIEALGRLLAAAANTGGEAFDAMNPPYEDGAAPGTVLLHRMGALRYHRADAHAAAWQAAGLTAAQIEAEPEGERRAAIEAETNRLAAPPFAVLTPAERATLLDDLAKLAV